VLVERGSFDSGTDHHNRRKREGESSMEKTAAVASTLHSRSGISKGRKKTQKRTNFPVKRKGEGQRARLFQRAQCGIGQIKSKTVPNKHKAKESSKVIGCYSRVLNQVRDRRASEAVHRGIKSNVELRTKRFFPLGSHLKKS